MNSQYQITKKLSSTLQGAIYEAKDLTLNRKVAIKVASKSQIAMEGVLENISKEVELMKKIDSEHVIKIIESFEDSKCTYVVMELAENGDLFTQLSKLQTFDEVSAKLYFKELCLAVKDLHHNNVCHLDISLENVLISKTGALKVCDFGVARHITSDSISTQNGQLRPGKLMYMSPECSALNEFDGSKADVYSLGILLFCMLYGFNPYTAEATLKFREFQSRMSSVFSIPSDEVLVDEYTEFLQQTPSHLLSTNDLAYGSILCNDADLLFDLHNVRGEASSLAEDLICSMLCLEQDRLSIEAVLEHPWMLE
jgi:serine/threonine protein kinase